MYELRIIWKDGRVTVQRRGWNPSFVREGKENISFNEKVIQSIELHDHEGCVDKIWDASW